MTGLIVNFTVEDDTATADHIELCGQLLEAGCIVQLPKPPKAGDVFKRACKTISVPDGYTWIDAGLSTDHAKIWKPIVGSLPESIWHVVLDKTTEEISLHPASHTTASVETPAAMNGFVADLNDYMVENSTKLRAYALREYTRRTLVNELYGVVTDFGILVSDLYKNDAETFCGVIDALDGCTVAHLPLVETENNDVANIVTAALQAEVNGLRSELDALVDSKAKLTKSRLESFGLRIDTIRGKLAAFNCSEGSDAVDLTAATHSFYAVAGQVKL